MSFLTFEDCQSTLYVRVLIILVGREREVVGFFRSKAYAVNALGPLQVAFVIVGWHVIVAVGDIEIIFAAAEREHLLRNTLAVGSVADYCSVVVVLQRAYKRLGTRSRAVVAKYDDF